MSRRAFFPHPSQCGVAARGAWPRCFSRAPPTHTRRTEMTVFPLAFAWLLSQTDPPAADRSALAAEKAAASAERAAIAAEKAADAALKIAASLPTAPEDAPAAAPVVVVIDEKREPWTGMLGIGLI